MYGRSTSGTVTEPSSFWCESWGRASGKHGDNVDFDFRYDLKRHGSEGPFEKPWRPGGMRGLA